MMGLATARRAEVLRAKKYVQIESFGGKRNMPLA
jgi:hypothetical protein